MKDVTLLLNDQEFKSLPDERKRKIINGFYKTEIESDPEFLNSNADTQKKVRNGYIRITDSSITDERFKSPEYQAEKLLLSQSVKPEKTGLVDVAVQYGNDIFNNVKSAIGIDVKEQVTPTPFFTKPVIMDKKQEIQVQKNINFLNQKQLETEKRVAEANASQQNKVREIVSKPAVVPIALMAGSATSFLGGLTANEGMKNAGDWLQDMAYTKQEKETDISTDFKKNPSQAVTKIVKATYQQAPQIALRFVGSGAGMTAKAIELLVVGAMGASSAGQKYIDLGKAGTPEKQRVLNSLLTGISAAGTEMRFGGASKVIQSMMKKGMTDAATDYAKRVIKQGVAKTLAKDAASVLIGEPVEDVVDEVATNLIDAMTGVKPLDWNKVGKDVINTAITSAGSSFLLGIAPVTMNTISSVQSKKYGLMDEEMQPFLERGFKLEGWDGKNKISYLSKEEKDGTVETVVYDTTSKTIIDNSKRRFVTTDEGNANIEILDTDDNVIDNIGVKLPEVTTQGKIMEESFAEPIQESVNMETPATQAEATQPTVSQPAETAPVQPSTVNEQQIEPVQTEQQTTEGQKDKTEEDKNEQYIKTIESKTAVNTKRAKLARTTEQKQRAKNSAETGIKEINKQLEKETKNIKKEYGKEQDSRTSDGTKKVKTKYVVLDLNDVQNSHDENLNWNENYYKPYQERDLGENPKNTKARLESQNVSFQPDMIINDYPVTSNGIPVMTKENMVIAGNTRTLGIKYGIKKGYESYNKYKEYLRENSEKFGFTKEQIDAFDSPYLVREIQEDLSDDEIKSLARDSNIQTNSVLTVSEQAKNDAENIDEKMLKTLKPSESGSFLAESNKTFMSKFLEKIPVSQRNQYLLNGEYTQDLDDRVRNALWVKIFGDSEESLSLLNKLAIDPDNDVKNITNSLLESVKYIVLMRSLKIKNIYKKMDIIKDFVSALGKMLIYKENNNINTVGGAISEMTTQQNIFGEMVYLTKLEKIILKKVLANYKNSGKMKSVIKGYFKNVYETEQEAMQTRIDNKEIDLNTVTPENYLNGNLYELTEVKNAKETGKGTEKASEQKGTDRGTQGRIRVRDDEQDQETGKERKVANEKVNYAYTVLAGNTNAKENPNPKQFNDKYNGNAHLFTNEETRKILNDNSIELSLYPSVAKNAEGEIVFLEGYNKTLGMRLNQEEKFIQYAIDNNIITEAKNEKEQTEKEGVQEVTKESQLEQFSKINPDDYKTYSPVATSQEQVEEVFDSLLAKATVNKRKDDGKTIYTLSDGTTVTVDITNDSIKVSEKAEAAGVYSRDTIEGKVSSLVRIAKHYNDSNFVAYHEGFHMAFHILLPMRDKMLLLREFNNDEEAMADAFASYCVNKNQRGVIKALFDKLLEELNKFFNHLFGIQSAWDSDAIFHDLKAGLYDVNANFQNEEFFFGVLNQRFGNKYTTITENELLELMAEKPKKKTAKPKTAKETVKKVEPELPTEMTKEKFDTVSTIKDVKAKQYYMYKTRNQFEEKLAIDKVKIDSLKGNNRKEMFDEYKKTVKLYIELVTPKKLKSGNTYKKFMSSIENYKKTETVINNYRKMIDYIEKYNKKLLIQRFNIELKKSKALRRLSVFKDIKRFAEMTNDEMVEESQKYANPDSENYNEVKAQLFSLFANIKDASAMKILVALGNLNYIKKTSKTLIEQNNEEIKAFADRLRKEYIEKLYLNNKQKQAMNIGGMTLDTAMKESDKVLGLASEGVKRNWFYQSLSLESFLNLMDNGFYDGYFYNSIFKPLYNLAQRKAEGVEKWNKFIEMGMHRAFGDDKVNSLEWARKMFDFQHIKRNFKVREMRTYIEDGVEKSAYVNDFPPMTPSELAELYLRWNDKDQRAGLIAHKGFNEESYKDVLEALKTVPEAKVYADFLKDEFFPVYGVTVNNVYRKVYNADLNLVKDYFPMSRDLDGQLDQKEENQNLILTVVNSHLYERVNSKKPIITGGNIVSMVSAHIEMMEQFKAYSEYYRLLRNLFNREMKQAITLAKGKVFADHLYNEIADIGMGGYKRNLATRGIRKLTNAFFNSALVINTVSALKQLSSAPLLSMASANKALFTLYYLTAPLRLKSGYKMIKSSAILTQRYNRLFVGEGSRILNEIISDKEFTGKKAVKAWRDLGVWYRWAVRRFNLTSLGDMLVTMTAGYSLYKTQYDTYIKQGMTEKDANDKALTDVEVAVNRTQQSSESLFTPALLRDTGILKLFTMFQSAPTALYNMEVSFINSIRKDIVEVIKTKNITGNERIDLKRINAYTSYLMAVATTIFLYHTITRGGTNIFDPEDKEAEIKSFKRTLIEQLIGVVPIIGSIFQTAGNIFFDTVEGADASRINFSPLGATVSRLMRTINKIKKNPDDEKAWFEMFKLFQAWIFGLPIDPITRITTGIADLIEEPDYRSFLRSLGYSDYALKADKK